MGPWTTNRNVVKYCLLVTLCMLVYTYFVFGIHKDDSLIRVHHEKDDVSFKFNTNYHLNPELTCNDKSRDPWMAMRNSFWVLYNYIRAAKSFHCNETITFTTHGDWRYLDNLEPLVERWQGPVSVALYSPGSDYMTTLNMIYFLRTCSKSRQLIQNLVTFHLFFDPKSFPKDKILSQDDLQNFKPFNCDAHTLEALVDKAESFKESRGLDYPINVARNVARETATSHFIFPSDIELYPSPNTISMFLDMVRRNDQGLFSKNGRRQVFVNSIFEIEKNIPLPKTKSELVQRLNQGQVVTFHRIICKSCHAIPGEKEWRRTGLNDTTMTVFVTAKRKGKYYHWEPIFIGTHSDPLYDERLSREGEGEKLSQGFQMCALDYDFHVLSHAFLIHRPGIKTVVSHAKAKAKDKIATQSRLISNVIMPHLHRIYGKTPGCAL